MTPVRIAVVCALSGLLLCSCDRSKPSAVQGAAVGGVAPVGPIPGPASRALMANPYAGDPSAMQEGRKLFIDFNCYGCHGGHAGGGMGPSLRDPIWIYGSSDADVFDSIAQGRAHGMPSWSMLPSDTIWKLTAYVKSLRTDKEVDPPG